MVRETASESRLEHRLIMDMTVKYVTSVILYIKDIVVIHANIYLIVLRKV